MGVSKLHDRPISAFQKNIVSSSNRFYILWAHWRRATFNHHSPAELEQKFNKFSLHSANMYQIIMLCTLNTFHLYLAFKYYEVKKK